MKTYLIYQHGIAPNFSYTFKEVIKSPSDLAGLVRCIQSTSTPTQLQMEAAFLSTQAQTVEKWIESQGFSAIRLLTIKDLESKLNAVNKESIKLTSIRQWVDNLISSVALSSAPRNDWPEAPFSFDEIIQEAVAALAQS